LRQLRSHSSFNRDSRSLLSIGPVIHGQHMLRYHIWKNKISA